MSRIKLEAGSGTGYVRLAGTHRTLLQKTSTARHITTELQADMHRQVHVHSGTPCKFNHYMRARFARNYSEALSHCGHGHDLTSVAQLSVINKADIRSALNKHWHQSAFAETLSTTCRSREARRRRASLLVYIYIAKSRIEQNHWPRFARSPHRSAMTKMLAIN